MKLGSSSRGRGLGPRPCCSSSRSALALLLLRACRGSDPALLQQLTQCLGFFLFVEDNSGHGRDPYAWLRRGEDALQAGVLAGTSRQQLILEGPEGPNPRSGQAWQGLGGWRRAQAGRLGMPWRRAQAGRLGMPWAWCAGWARQTAACTHCHQSSSQCSLALSPAPPPHAFPPPPPPTRCALLCCAACALQTCRLSTAPSLGC